MTEEKKKPTCPFRGESCIGSECAIAITLTEQRVGQLGVPMMMQKTLCSLPAIAEILTIQQRQQQQVPVNFDNLFDNLKEHKGG